MLLATAAVSAGCGEFTREGHSPVVVEVRSLEAASGAEPDKLGGVLYSDVQVLVTKPDPCSTASPCPTTFADLGEVTMSLILKDPGVAGIGSNPSLLNSVTINRYHVSYRRADGRNAQGTDVPYAFDSAVTFTIPSDGVISHSFEIVRHVAKHEAPLRALLSSGNIISTIADVTFYGRDQAGNDVAVNGSIGVNFGDFGDPQ